MTNEDILGLNAAQAAIHYEALKIGVDALRSQTELKAAKPFLPAIKGQIAQYEAEIARLASHFPTLKPQ